MTISCRLAFAVLCTLFMFVGGTCAWTTTSVTFSSHQKNSKRCSEFKRLSPLNSSNSDGDSDDEPKLRSLSELLMPNPKCNPTQMSPTSLAYIGDSVFELFARSRYVFPSRRTTDLQKIVVEKVRAETQSKFFQSLIASESFELTQEEKIIVSRGRNAGASSGGRKRGPKRLYASNSNEKKSANGGPSAYQDSTALEALIGYVYLTDEKRCAELIRFICAELDKMDDEGP